jgi:hypothetical protein
MNRRFYDRLALVPVLALSGIVLSVLGQDAAGRIAGTVVDPSGAVIVGVKITVTNTGTGVSRETISSNEGNYQVVDLPIGMYRITAEKPGFTRLVTSDQKLLIGQTLRMDLSMTVGSTTETVQVQEVASAVEPPARCWASR